MVDALASDRSDQSFGKAVLPRRAWSDRFVADAHGSQSMPDGNAIDPIPIADQVARGLIPRECLRDLARDPVRGRMLAYNLTRVMNIIGVQPLMATIRA